MKNDDNKIMSRTERNKSLYNTISEQEITNFDVNSNSEIIGVSNDAINIDMLRDMLDKKYREEPKNRSIGDTELQDTGEVKLNETREYDINQILNKAKEDKPTVDYEVERLKKLRNTQTDILEGLDIESVDKVEKEEKISKSEKDELMDLINTINVTEELNKKKIKEKKEQQEQELKEKVKEAMSDKEVDPLDLLSTLKGDNEDTKVFNKEDFTKELQEDKKEENKIDNSFYTKSNMFKQSDFDDFADLKEDVGVSKIIIRIIIVLIIIAFLVGIFFILNKVLDWGII